MQQRFEELISELERLKSAAVLVESNATHTEDLRKQTTSVIEGLQRLLPDLRTAINDKISQLDATAATFGEQVTRFDHHLSTAADIAEKHHNDLNSALAQGHEAQRTLLEASTNEQTKQLSTYLQQFSGQIEDHAKALADHREAQARILQRTEARVQDAVEALNDKQAKHLQGQGAKLKDGIEALRDQLASFTTRSQEHLGEVADELRNELEALRTIGAEHQALLEQSHRQSQALANELKVQRKALQETRQEASKQHNQLVAALHQTSQRLVWGLSGVGIMVVVLLAIQLLF